jgi:GTP:adenosylcobinamide-phosphate guanylyltransferase/aminoglycoside phosphotransferase
VITAETEYIIVQAGGKGTRLGHLTENKPKALVPVLNLPMLFHLFGKFKDKRFIVVADYKREVLRRYLECFADVKYQVVDADGAGTCGGLRQAAALLPRGEPFVLIWSDLILPESFRLPAEAEDRNYVGISEDFPCRWSCENGGFAEKRSEEYGVAGLFVFKDKDCLDGVPQSGEFVRWLRDQKMNFEPLGLAGTREFGTLREYAGLDEVKTRPFNKITFGRETVVKEALDEQGRGLAAREAKWYEFAAGNGVTAIPKIYGDGPLTMERIVGANIYETAASAEVLGKIIAALKDLHAVKSVRADPFSLKDAYYGKTMARLDKIRGLVPFADERTVNVNGRECRNVFFIRREFETLLDGLSCERFAFIHGDCTFSNMMLRENGEPVFIDPRGYFGHTELFGDPNYDFAKLYYSIVGNYDRFNLKDFRLRIRENSVELDIASNGWECTESEFFRLSGADERTIKLIHAVIWLSLTTYAWQDYDSVCGAFYNGLYYLEECPEWSILNGR